MKKLVLILFFVSFVVLVPSSAHAEFLRTLAPGDTGNDVTYLQRVLNGIGKAVTAIGEETKYFGTATAEMVRALQCEYGIVCEGTPATTGFGLVGPKTQNLLAAVAGSISSGAPTQGLVAWYPFDEGTGATTVNAVDNKTVGIGSSAWTSGRIGKALSSTVEGAEVAIPAVASGTRTISLWVNPTSLRYYSILFEDTANNYAGINLLGQMRVNWKNNAGESKGVNMTANATAGSWQMFTFVYTATSIQLFRNGELIATAEEPAGIAASPIGYIGGRGKNSGDGYFGGGIDDVRIYSRALSASEIRALYAAADAPVVTPTPTVPTADKLKPSLARIATTNVGTSSARIIWETNEPATTVVQYGLTTTYGTNATGASPLTLAHELLLTGLTPSTLYNYRVVSADAAGNSAQSLNRSFSTKAGLGTPAPTPEAPLPLPTANTYYVDFATGSDLNPGTILAPWKHAPGDPSATGNPAKVVLKSGNTIQFKSGVTYYGMIAAKASGVIYKGTGWGIGKAIIDGSEPLTGLRRCSSAADCAGNANWQRMYKATITVPAHITETPELHLHIMSGSNRFTLAQQPASTNRYYQAFENFYSVPASKVTTTSLSDPRLASLGGATLVGSIIQLWGQPNEVHARKITGYNAATNTVTFASFAAYTDRDTKFAIANNPSAAVFDTAGEFYFNAATKELYLLPFADTDVAQGSIMISVRPYGISLGSYDDLTIDGFIVRRQSGDGTREGHGIVKFVTTDSGSHVISNNEVAYGYSPRHGGAIGLLSVNDTLIQDNYVHDIGGNLRGISVSGEDVTVRGNHVKNVARTGIYFGEMTDGTMDGNLVEDNNSVHGNGMSVYQGSKGITISNNTIRRSNIAFTMEQSSNIRIVNNLFDGSNETSVVFADWGGMTGKNFILNNTIVGSNKDAAFHLGSAEKPALDVHYTVQNNIIDGGGPKTSKTTYTNNLYVALGHFQTARYGWSLGAAESVVTDQSSVFVNPTASNYALKATSPAIDKGMSPAGGLTRDLLGNLRPSGSGYDIGAYEYQR